MATKREVIVKQAKGYIGHAYVMGGTGQPCAPSYRKARAEQYPGSADNIKKNCQVMSGKASSCDGCKWKGKLCFDCAQLTRAVAKAAGYDLVSGATSQWNKTDWQEKGLIKDAPDDTAGVFYYRQEADGKTMAHTGVGIGDGKVVEAMSHDTGVVERELAKRNFTHYSILRGEDDVIGDPDPQPDPAPTTDQVIVDTSTASKPGGDLLMRKTPGGEYERKIPNNTVIPVLGRADGWIKTKYLSDTGWVDEAYTRPYETTAKGYRLIVDSYKGAPLEAEQSSNLRDELMAAGYNVRREEV